VVLKDNLAKQSRPLSKIINLSTKNQKQENVF